MANSTSWRAGSTSFIRIEAPDVDAEQIGDYENERHKRMREFCEVLDQKIQDSAFGDTDYTKPEEPPPFLPIVPVKLGMLHGKLRSTENNLDWTEFLPERIR